MKLQIVLPILALPLLAAAILRPSPPIQAYKAVPRKLFFQTRMEKMQDAIALLSESDKASLAEKDFTIDGDAIESKKEPAIGAWLKVGDEWVMCDEEGSFELPESVAETKTASLYLQAAAEEPLAEVDISGEENLYVFKGSPGSAMQMDAKEDEMALRRMHGHGPLEQDAIPAKCKVHKCDIEEKTIKGCCQDFDGPLAVDKTVRILGVDQSGMSDSDCMSMKKKAFVASICSYWVARGPCYNEAGFRGIIEQNPNLPGCYANHRGRWCQHLDPDNCSAEVADGGSAECAPGGKVKLVVTNGTPANSTVIRLGYPILGSQGEQLDLVDTKKGVFTSPSTDRYRLDHYIDTVNPTNKAVFTQAITLEYTAPDALPGGKTEATEHLTFDFWGKKMSLDITI